MTVRICLLGLALLVGAAITRAVVQAPAVAGESNAALGESHDSRLLQYRLTTDPGGTLANAWVLLRAEPEKLRPAPPQGQAASFPDSRWTVYTDIDGDSVFDTMVKVGPKQDETYVLYRNTWIEVGNQMAQFTVGSVVRAKADGTEYVFKGARLGNPKATTATVMALQYEEFVASMCSRCTPQTGRPTLSK